MKKKIVRIWCEPTEHEQAVVMSCMMAGLVVASANVNTTAIAYVLRVLFG